MPVILYLVNLHVLIDLYGTRGDVSTLRWMREVGGATKLPVSLITFFPDKLRVPSIANIFKVQFSEYDTQFFQKEDGSKFVP